MLPRIILSLALIAATPTFAQTAQPTLHTTAELKQIEAKLMASAKASPKGAAFTRIDNFPTARTLLVVRVHTGDAERHQLWADQIVVNKGTLTLVTGGTMLAEIPNGTEPGETLGSGIAGGKEVTIRAGDTVHIPANIPHWVKLDPGTTTTYLVFKEK
jgi:hypothetical protein